MIQLVSSSRDRLRHIAAHLTGSLSLNAHMRPEKPFPPTEDVYARQARKLEELEQSVFLVIAAVAAILALLNLWQPFTG